LTLRRLAEEAAATIAPKCYTRPKTNRAFWDRKLEDNIKGKRGQAYNLNLAGSDILAPDGRGNWHISPKCSNRAFWDRKCEENMARDRRVNRSLRGRGWKVIRTWQHALQKSSSACLNRIRRALAA
jgi:G:T-mismatch repair DNA endonuclease (very short patch repair protein)